MSTADEPKPDATHEHPERVSTDASLKTEREKTDKQFGAKQAASERLANNTLKMARSRADRVLEISRRLEDARDENAPPEVHETVDQERSIADAVINQERRSSDVQLQATRNQRNVIQELLRMEREETDEQLLLERDRLDWLLSSQDDFLAMVAHDVRNLLTTMALSAARIIQFAPEDEPGPRIVGQADRIQWAVARTQRLLSDLTDVTAISSGKLRVVPVAGNVLETVEEVAQSYYSSAEAAGISLTTPESTTPLLALFDRDRVVQVLSNLLSNALKFTPRGGAVAIRVRREEAMIDIEVSDTGTGIPPSKRDLIFERFKQVSFDRRGLGLGLYITRMIIEGHGGRIWVENAPGSGATFHFTLPTA